MRSYDTFFKHVAAQGHPSRILDLKYPQQHFFVTDPADRLVALCTRRAGKTTGVALRLIRAMLTYPHTRSRYIALTFDSAHEIMWPVLLDLDKRFQLRSIFTESNLTMKLPNGSSLRLFGADMKNFINRLKGVKCPAIAIDEAQDFGPHLESLIYDVLEPSLADFKGSWLSLTGTPGPFPRGLFYEMSEQKKYGYSVHRWSLFQNPYLPDPRGFVEKIKTKRGLTDEHPTIQREYYGKWVLDVESLLIQYEEARNTFSDLPESTEWHYILGVDIGHKDSDAIAVIAYSDKSKTAYLVEELITARQDLSELERQLNTLIEKYHPHSIIMDEGGLGKKIGEEFRRRKGIAVEAADKSRKMENVALLNDALRCGTFKARSTSRFVSDSYQVQIDYDRSTPDRLVVKSGFHSDIIDAVLYAFKKCPSWSYQEPPPVLKPGSQPWIDREVSDLEASAEAYFSELERNA